MGQLIDLLIWSASFVLASTQELHEKIAELAHRVRELEDALRSSHSQLSNDGHPLLSDDLLKVKHPLQREPPHQRNGNAFTVKEEETNPDVVDAFGSLSINLSGKSRYYGHIANSWVSTHGHSWFFRLSNMVVSISFK